MEVSDILYFGDEAKNKIIAGVDKLANAVKITMGPGGRTVVMRDKSGKIIITADGVTVAKYIDLVDPIEDMGAQIMKDPAIATVDLVGDGTTTATVLAQALVKRWESVTNIRLYCAGMLDARNAVVDKLDGLKKEIKTLADLHNIAITSANGDESIADNVSKVIHSIGPSGIVEVVPSEMPNTTVEIESGYKFDNGYPTSRFITEANLGQCVLPHNGDGHDGGWVMCISDDVDDFKALLPAINHAKQHGKFLVIIGKKFSEDVIRNCEKNFMYGTRVIPVVAPDFGDRMIFNLEDIAIYADTTVISMTEIKAATKGEFEMPKMGAIDTLKVGSNYTKLYSEEADSRVATRIKQLTNQINAANNKFDKKKLEKRIAQLSAGLAVIRVGGKTSTEIQERFDRYEDAVGATLAASREGVLPGGGIALYNASMGIERTSEPDTQFGLGWDNMLMACLAPHHQILANAEIEGDGSQDDPSMGIDAQTGEIVNMFDAGIVDPFVVTTSALDSALSIANLLLGVGCTIDSTSINIIPG